MLLPAAAPQRNYMLEHRNSKLAFTGSTEVGYEIAAAAAKG